MQIKYRVFLRILASHLAIHSAQSYAFQPYIFIQFGLYVHVCDIIIVNQCTNLVIKTKGLISRFFMFSWMLGGCSANVPTVESLPVCSARHSLTHGKGNILKVSYLCNAFEVRSLKSA